MMTNTLLRKMKRSGIVIQDIYDKTETILRLDISDTSDAHWSPVIRNSWHHFITGVCEMWLKMIDEITVSDTSREKPVSLRKLIERYKNVNEKLTEAWQKEGEHALLHHLNAIFGYVPLMVHEMRWARY